VDLGLSGRIALVTAASGGLGLAVARALVAEGANVAITSRSAERIEAAAGSIGARGYVHETAALEEVPDLVGRVGADLGGPVEILVTNTGGPPADPDALAFTQEQWQAAYRDLVLAPMAMISEVLPGMRERRWGRILNLSSSVVREPIPNLVLSTAHRSALLAAHKTLAGQVAADGVTVNTLLPGRIATKRLAEVYGSLEAAEEWARQNVPAGRLGTVEEYAAAATFLCSAPASYITGVALLVDGGLTHLI
jgi:3-oxoacyl-[acyl-carrier protein] reductase